MNTAPKPNHYDFYAEKAIIAPVSDQKRVIVSYSGVLCASRVERIAKALYEAREAAYAHRGGYKGRYSVKRYIELIKQSAKSDCAIKRVKNLTVSRKYAGVTILSNEGTENRPEDIAVFEENTGYGCIAIVPVELTKNNVQKVTLSLSDGVCSAIDFPVTFEREYSGGISHSEAIKQAQRVLNVERRNLKENDCAIVRCEVEFYNGHMITTEFYYGSHPQHSDILDIYRNLQQDLIHKKGFKTRKYGEVATPPSDAVRREAEREISSYLPAAYDSLYN